MTWCFYAGPGGVSVAQRRHATCPDLTREERHTAATSRQGAPASERSQAEGHGADVGRGSRSTVGQPAVGGGLVDGEDADNGRVEVEDFGSRLGEAGGLEQVCDLAGGVERGVPRGSWAAWLGGDGDASAWRESPPQVFEPLGRCRPEPEGVDGEDGVEGAVEGWRQVFD